MRIFEKNDKINFVDENSVFVGFDYLSNCCERFGYYFSDTEKADPDKEGEGISGDSLAGFLFDTKFCGGEEEEAVFRLFNESGATLYLHLFNHHNGYYSHGFEMGLANEVFHSGSI